MGLHYAYIFPGAKTVHRQPLIDYKINIFSVKSINSHIMNIFSLRETPWKSKLQISIEMATF